MGSNIGTGEILVILIVGLLVVGPEKLPKLARAFGKAIAGFKGYMNDVTADLKDATDLTDISDSLSEMQKDLRDTFSGATDDVRDAVKLKGNSTEKNDKDGKVPLKKAADKKAEVPVGAEVKSETAEAVTPEENVPAGDSDANEPLAEQQ